MKRWETVSRQSGALSVYVGGMVGLLVVLALVVAPSAWASFEQVATFGENSETSPLARTESVAVNSTGVGGVPAGTIYVVSNSVPGVRMYDAEGKLIGQWGSVDATDVAVDQATGDVYVRIWAVAEGSDDIRVYSADGSQEIASFGVIGNTKESVSESPEKIHIDVNALGLAVDAAGDVYISDYTPSASLEESRVMVFKPQSAGDYEHYVYAGQGSDIAHIRLGEGANYFAPTELAVDTASDIYLIADGGEAIVEFNPGAPGVPVCSYKIPRGGGSGITVNPATKQVYYYTAKDKSHIYQLECNTEGKFVETGSFAIAPAVGTSILTSHMPALAFNPVLKYEGVHPAGAVYAISEVGVGYILAPAVSRVPVVESTAAVSVTSSGALLGGVVNPKGFATRYVFQYIDNAAYVANEPGEPFAGAAEAPVGGGSLSGGTSGLAVEAALSGLAPDTTYHYRIVAVSHCNPSEEAEVCEVPGAAQTFHTFPSEEGVLPDGRAYELVSPALKSGGEVFPLYPSGGSCNECKPGVNGYAYPEQAGPDGEAVVFMGFPFSFTEGAQQADEYIARRGATGWQTTTLSSELTTRKQGYVGFDASLGKGVLTQGNEATLSASAPVGYPNLYGRLTGETADAFTPLVTAQPPDRSGSTGRGESQFHVRFAGGSADYSKLFFEANDALTGETAFAPAAVDGGQEVDDLYESTDEGLSLVNVLPGNTTTAPGAAIGRTPYHENNETLFDYSHAVSADGSRVFWSDASGQVYIREDGQSTREVPDHTGRFLTAATDGSKVLLDDGQLYDLEDEQTIDLTEGNGGFLGIAGQSEDLSHVYFVDSQAITSEEQINGHGEHAEVGKDNLYAWFEGTPTFIGQLLGGDGKFNFFYGAWTAAPAVRSAEASPDGRWLAFLSEASLTGYDNVGPCQQKGTNSCKEVYLYDSASGQLICGSCDRSGLPPLGPSHVPLLLNAPTGFEQVRYLTDQGRLYFDSADSLSPFDSNHGVEDVYQYEPEGVGGCERGEGCVNLISSGRGSYDSNFLASDADGKNVFFTTRDRLVAADHDGLMDLYDAREGGGIQAQSEAAQNGGCHGEACQSPVTSGGGGGSVPSSLSFEGPGDLLASSVTVTVKAASPKAKSPSRAQQLARALSQCHRKPKRKRPACEKAARKRFGGKTAGKAATQSGKAKQAGKAIRVVRPEGGR